MPAMSSTSSAASRVLLGALLALALLILPACHLPTPLKELDEPRLEAVQRDYQHVVHFAHNHPHEDWYHGWYGNFWRNWHRGNRRGLCYEWQAVVYEGVRESAPAAGFVAIGIMKDRDQSTEHHAVLLFEKGDIVSSTQDGTGPNVAIVSPASGTSTATNTITFSGTSSDALSGVTRITVNGVAATSANNFASWTITVPLGFGSLPSVS